MKRYQKLYAVADNVTPVEVQVFDDRKVELFLMDDFEGIKEEFVYKKNELAVWSSVDGKNYRIFLENGYYDRVKELYSEPVNKIWIDFWDKSDSISGKFSKMFIYPLMFIAIIIAVLSLALQKYMENYVSYIIIGVLVVLFISLIFVNMYVKKVIVKESTKSRQQIIDYFGEARFDELIELQKAYLDEFYDKYYAEKEAYKAKEEALNNSEETTEVAAIEEVKEETTEISDETTNNEEPVVEEIKEDTEVKEEANTLEEKEEASVEEEKKEVE